MNYSYHHYFCLIIIILFSLINPLIASPPSPPCHPDDIKVLMHIKHYFNNVYPFSEWHPKHHNHCCDWDVVGCDNGGDTEFTPPPGRVTSFILFGNINYGVDMIAGEIPPFFADLPYLHTIKFANVPNLTGSIPLTFKKLANLSSITLDTTNLSGPIPEILSQIKTLKRIELISSGFSGTIPSSLSLLPNLRELVLSQNNLSGSIPGSFGSFKSRLSMLRLDTNGLSGPIPKSLGQANIEALDLSQNNFTGDATFLFKSDKPMQQVILRQNHFKFNFSYVDLPWSLNYIDMSYNQLYGSLPRRLGQLPKLIYVSFRFNHLCGKVPKGGRLKQFKAFFNNKCLCDAPGLPVCK